MAARNARNISDFLPRSLCVLEVDLRNVLDLRLPESLEIVGLDLDTVRSNNMRPCQGVGFVAHKLGLEALLAPSATGIGHTLVVFPLNLELDSSVAEIEVLVWRSPADVPRIDSNPG